MSNHVVTTHNAADLSDDEISVEALLYNTIEAEVWPEDPVTPRQDAVAAARAVPARVTRMAFRAWDGGLLVGSVQVAIDREHDDNTDVLGRIAVSDEDHDLDARARTTAPFMVVWLTRRGARGAGPRRAPTATCALAAWRVSPICRRGHHARHRRVLAE